MTRPYNTFFDCPSCGCVTSTETSFGRWVRENKELDSTKGIVIYDVDYIVHRYKRIVNGIYRRDFQLIMLVEVKTRMSPVDENQRDTLYILNQIIENRKVNNRMMETGRRHNNKHRTSFGPHKVWSSKNKRWVYVRSFGVFTLRFSGLGPADSDSILWNKREIDASTLEKLLLFEIDPDNFLPMDEVLRNRHKRNSQMGLFESETN